LEKKRERGGFEKSTKEAEASVVFKEKREGALG